MLFLASHGGLLSQIYLVRQDPTCEMEKNDGYGNK